MKSIKSARIYFFQQSIQFFSTVHLLLRIGLVLGEELLFVEVGMGWDFEFVL